MTVDVLEADLAGTACNDLVGVAPRRIDAQRPKPDLMVKVLQRDDPLRLYYLQKRWHGRSALVPYSREMERYTLERTSSPPIVLSRR